LRIPSTLRCRQWVNVDFAGDAPAFQRRIGGFDHLGDELMSQHAGETHVALRDLQIRGADARAADAQERVAIGQLRLGMVYLEGKGLIESQRTHRRTF
jgi:hypothetical protein